MKLTSISDATQLQLKRTKLDLSSALSNVERLNRNLEAVSQEKDEILALAAHDLRSPLSGIRGLADLIVEESETTPGDVHSYAREIVNVADDTLEMIRDILDIYRLDGGTADGQTTESIRISDLLSEASDISRANALRKRITMVIESVNADRSILIEKPLVVRVLENLVSNALKYSPRESTVTVRIDIEGKFLQMVVRDQGPGLSEADQAKLFKKFARLASRPTGGESSIGLGLAIVDRIVQHLGGRVWVETIPGQGATFKVELPVTVLD
jgi:signal transduction histidine kinase